MKKIGLLGGMSWESSALYYEIINKELNRRLGRLHSAKVILNSVDFEEIEKLQYANRWDEAGEILAKEAKALENAGAEAVLLCTNTMHKVAHKIIDAIDIEFLHIADATAKELIKNGIKKVALLGTIFTMEQSFYKDRIKSFGVDVIVPNREDRELINKVIYNELCLGVTKEESKKRYLQIIQDLAKEGAEGVILGCTEIGMLIKQNDTDIKLFDTTKIHALSGVDFVLS